MPPIAFSSTVVRDPGDADEDINQAIELSLCDPDQLQRVPAAAVSDSSPNTRAYQSGHNGTSRGSHGVATRSPLSATVWDIPDDEITAAAATLGAMGGALEIRGRGLSRKGGGDASYWPGVGDADAPQVRS